MTMEDWAVRLNKFLDFNEVDILTDKERVSAEIAKTFAESEFEKYRIVQDKLFKSDFDQFLKETKEVESDEARESLLPFLYSYFPHGSGQPL